MTTFRSRTRRSRNAASRRSCGGARAFFSDEIRFKSVPPKTSGIPTLFIDAKYPNPRGDAGEVRGEALEQWDKSHRGRALPAGAAPRIGQGPRAVSRRRGR